MMKIDIIQNKRYIVVHIGIYIVVHIGIYIVAHLKMNVLMFCAK